MSLRLLLFGLLAALALAAPAAHAQTPAAPPLPAPAGTTPGAPAVPSAGNAGAAPVAKPAAPAAAVADSSLRCGRYAFLSFLIYDSESGPEPVVAEGVGGTLTLLPDGRFEQRLRLGLPPKTTTFERTGRYQLLAGRKLRFSYQTSQNKPRTDLGSYRYDAAHGALVITIEGFPAGSYSVYTLVAADAPTGPK